MTAAPRTRQRHIYSASDNADKLTLRTYETFGFTLAVFIDNKDAEGYGEPGSRFVALSLDEAKELADSLFLAIVATRKASSMACTCNAWDHVWEDEFGKHLVHSESCVHYDD